MVFLLGWGEKASRTSRARSSDCARPSMEYVSGHEAVRNPCLQKGQVEQPWFIVRMGCYQPTWSRAVKL